MQTLKEIIAELVEANPNIANGEITSIATARIGRNYDQKYVSRIRNKMGLGRRSQTPDDLVNSLLQIVRSEEYSSLFGPLQSAIQSGEIDKQLQSLSLVIAVTCVRNTVIEDYHAGRSPQSKTGDYSDVKVVTPFGEIPWTEVSRLTDPEMKDFNIQVSNRIYTLLQVLMNPKFEADRDDMMACIGRSYPTDWNQPQLDDNLMRLVELFRRER